MAQESKYVGMSLRNTADRQSRAASQAAPYSALPPRESLPPQPGVGKKGRQSRLHVVPAAVPSLLDLHLPQVQHPQKDLQAPSNQQSSQSPHNQSNPKSNDPQKFSLSTRSETNPAPPPNPLLNRT